MPNPTDHIRLLFGLKLHQLRLDRGLSASELATRAGLAVSYISEIEKGRKYPKTDKIAALARALDVDYDQMVSLKLSKKLEPISEFLRSKFLNEVPLEFFGVDPADLLALLAEAPAKVSAMIKTFMDVALSYNMSVERLFLTMLRAYQELHDNHFADIEADADRFLTEFAPNGQPVSDALLHNLLKTQYGVQFTTFDPAAQAALAGVRSVFKAKTATLHLSATLRESQRAYVLAREVAFHYLGLKVRPATYPSAEAESFEQVLNNYKASYFAGAVLIRRDALVARLTTLFAQPTWDNERFLALIAEFGATPERFFYRLSNVLPRDFGIDQLFFYRFNHQPGQPNFYLTKEMHLARQRGPRGIVDEHFCRRWVALTALQELQFLQQHKSYAGVLGRAQLSRYADSGQEFLVITVAYPGGSGQNMSVSMCFAVNETLRSKMAFLRAYSPDQPPTDVPFRIVNEACERCALFDCRERVAAPVVLQQKRSADETKRAVEQL